MKYYFFLLSFFLIQSGHSQFFPKIIKIDILRDSSNTITFEQAASMFSSGSYKKLKEGEGYTIPNVTNWLRAPIDSLDPRGVLNLSGYFNETCMYYFSPEGKVIKQCTGFNYPLSERQFQLADAKFYVPLQTKDGYFYFRLRSNIQIGISLELEPIDYLTNTYFKHQMKFAFFIGMVLIVCIYNLILFFSLREKIYVFYSLYLFAFAGFALVYSSLGNFLLYKFDMTFAYYTYFFALMTIALLFYSKYFFKGITTLPYFERIINILVAIRVLIFIIGQISGNYYLHRQIVDYVLLIYPFAVGLISVIRGQKFVIYFVLGFSTIFIAYFFHAFMPVEMAFFYIGAIDIVLFSLSISERFRIIKIDKENEQVKTIALQTEMLERSKENEALKDQMNRNLEILVEERTTDLQQANATLNKQAEEIKLMNEELMKYNQELVHEMEIISKARILEKNVDLENFAQLFPDDNTCLGFLAELKWSNGYSCRKCGNTKSFEINAVPHARRCAKCTYQESATAFTVLDNVKFSIQKALYIVYITFGNPLVNINQMAKKLDLRPATCFNFSKKIIDKADKFKANRKKNNEWVNFLLFNPS